MFAILVKIIHGRIGSLLSNSFFFPLGFSTGLVQLYIAGLPLRSCWTIGAPSVQGAFPNVQFSFLAVAGFEPTSLLLQRGLVNSKDVGSNPD